MITKVKKLQCKKCRSRSRFEVILCPDDDDNYNNWIIINCKRCGRCLFYNRA